MMGANIPASTFYATNGVDPTNLLEVDEHYFDECRLAGAGYVEVLTGDSAVERIIGTRYLRPGTGVTAAVADGQVHISYEGTRLRTVGQWRCYSVFAATLPREGSTAGIAAG